MSCILIDLIKRTIRQTLLRSIPKKATSIWKLDFYVAYFLFFSSLGSLYSAFCQ